MRLDITYQLNATLSKNNLIATVSKILIEYHIRIELNMDLTNIPDGFYGVFRITSGGDLCDGCRQTFIYINRRSSSSDVYLLTYFSGSSNTVSAEMENSLFSNKWQKFDVIQKKTQQGFQYRALFNDKEITTRK